MTVNPNNPRQALPRSILTSADRLAWLAHVLPDNWNAPRRGGGGGSCRDTNVGIERVASLIPHGIVLRSRWVATWCPGFAVIIGGGCDYSTVGLVCQELNVLLVVVSEQTGQMSRFTGPNHVWLRETLWTTEIGNASAINVTASRVAIWYITFQRGVAWGWHYSWSCANTFALACATCALQGASYGANRAAIVVIDRQPRCTCANHRCQSQKAWGLHGSGPEWTAVFLTLSRIWGMDDWMELLTRPLHTSRQSLQLRS